jgi:hypothetical protein
MALRLSPVVVARHRRKPLVRHWFIHYSLFIIHYFPSNNFKMKWLLRILLGLWILLAGPVAVLIFGNLNLENEFNTTNKSIDTNLARPPETLLEEAIIQLYAARTFNWRGAFFVHTWFTAKRSKTSHYKVYQIKGWHYFSDKTGLVLEKDTANRYWFGQPPQLLGEVRGGTEVEQLIDKLEAAVNQYPYPDIYKNWPGPNSNTFTAFIARQVPELRMQLPPNAIGKDFLLHGDIFAYSPSGTGAQLSFYGILGILVGLEEGIEVNILTLTIGIDPLRLALKLPGIGRVGWK